MKKLLTISAILAVFLLPQAGMGQEVRTSLQNAIQQRRIDFCISMAFSGDKTKLEKCIKDGFDPNTKFEGMPISFASVKYPHVLRILGDTGKLDINATDEEGHTLLMFSAMEGNQHVISSLIILYRADKTLKDKFGFTANDYAKKHYQTTMDLLEGKINITQEKDYRISYFFMLARIKKASELSEKLSHGYPYY